MKRVGVTMLAAIGLLLAVVVAVLMGAGTVAALWSERWQFVVAGVVVAGLIGVSAITRR